MTVLPPGLRLGVLKPHFGVVGGFEAVADRVETSLRAQGHDVTRLTIDLPSLPPTPYEVAVPPDVAAAAPEFVRYVAAIEAFERLRTGRFDAVISTQPPSFATPHPHHLSLFFHHHRIYYDLEDVWLEAGLADDPDLHRHAGALVRRLDRPRLDRVAWFAAGSESVRRRLGRYNGIDRVSLFHAGIAVGDAADGAEPVAEGHRSGPVLCVGRLEFPKRPELFVSALRRLPGVDATLVGTGGREAWVRSVDHRLAAEADLDAVDDRALWCCRPDVTEPAPEDWRSNIEIAGRVDDATLGRLYATTPCVVAPALAEDYGLTAIEAMAHGAPAIVCDDGGGLADLVTHEVDGLVVAPTGAAIAAAVDRVLSDPHLAAELAAGARATAARSTWDRADDEIRTALALALDIEPGAAA